MVGYVDVQGIETRQGDGSSQVDMGMFQGIRLESGRFGGNRILFLRFAPQAREGYYQKEGGKK